MTQTNTHSTPVLLLTGYLGSGKTTLVNHILTNQKGIRFAVIVNDIGEVNIDARLIQKEGIVSMEDNNLVALQNGCICCTLKMDLVKQINQLLKLQCFDYIVIEASGICEPQPIASTISNMPFMEEEFTQWGVPELDCIVTVVDALRMRDEFANGGKLLGSVIGEEDIENLIIQQIEFCNIILLNKTSEVEHKDIDFLYQIIKQLNPIAQIIATDYANVDLDQILNTQLFDFSDTEGSANWLRHMERAVTKEEKEEARRPHHHHEHDEHHHEHEHEEHHDHEEDHDHEHHDHEDEHDHEHHHHEHHHHHHHGEGEVEEYGISTFMYFRRQPMDIAKFDNFVNLHWPKSVIRAKGLCYFSDDDDMAYLFEQAGAQVSINQAGKWCATMDEDELRYRLAHDAALANEWDDYYGDRMQKIVFIGQKMDKDAITRALDNCLAE